MPLLLAQIERLASARFILLIAAISGTVQAVPVFLHARSLNFATARLGQLALITSINLVWWIGAALLWWFAVRRRQHPIWLTALHVTLGLAVGDILMNSLGFVASSIQTRGEFAIAFGRALPNALSGPVGIALLRSPFWFVQAVALIAVGRLVLHMDALIVPSPVEIRR
ncbi:MAG TPA: hypothetical protein VIP11_04610 [Gemmatimonadaceae bacterium]